MVTPSIAQQLAEAATAANCHKQHEKGLYRLGRGPFRCLRLEARPLGGDVVSG